MPLFFTVFFLASLVALSDPTTSNGIDTFQRKIVKAVKLSKGAQASELALDIVRQKIKSRLWSLANHPNSAQAMLLKPRLSVTLVLDSDVDSIAPRWEILEHFSGGVCRALPEPVYSVQSTNPQCLNSSTQFSPDNTKLGSVEMSPEAGREQRGFITFLNLDLLSEEESSNLFSAPGFVLSETSQALQSVPVKFLTFVPYENDPNRLKSLRVQAGNMIGEIPISEPGYCVQVSCSARYTSGANSNNLEWQDEACSTGLKVSDGWDWDGSATCDTDAKAGPCERLRGHFSSNDPTLPNTLDLKLRNWSPRSPCDRDGICNSTYTMTSRACRPGGALPLQYVESGTGRIVGIDLSPVASRQLASLSCPSIPEQSVGCTGLGSASCVSPKRAIGKSSENFCRASRGNLGHFVVSEVSQGMTSYWLSSAGRLFGMNRARALTPSSLWMDGKIISLTSHQGSWYALRSDGALLKSNTPEDKNSFLEVPCVKLKRATSLVSDELLCL